MASCHDVPNIENLEKRFEVSESVKMSCVECLKEEGFYFGRFYTPFPLTPALSLGEREKSSAKLEHIVALVAIAG
jgi:hypothetical protein